MRLPLNGIDIHYTRQGRGPDVILLSGWGYGLELLDGLAKGLEGQFTVLRLDFPGQGSSGLPEKPLTAEDFARTVTALCGELGIQKACFIGHSNGGRVILALSQLQPDLVEKAILCGGAGLRKKRGPRYYGKVYSYKLAKKFLGLPLFPKAWQERLQKNSGSPDYRALSGVMRATFSNLVNSDYRQALPRIPFPVLLVWGDKDAETPLWMAEVMQKEIPDCGLVTYPGLGHYAFLERLPAFLRTAVVFFGGSHA